MKYMYTVWLTDPSLPEEDPDYEWPACFVVDAATQSSAKEWGDHLTIRYITRVGGAIIRSEVESIHEVDPSGIETLPIIPEGHEATDEEIGW